MSRVHIVTYINRDHYEIHEPKHDLQIVDD